MKVSEDRELVEALLYLSITTHPDIWDSDNCLNQIQEHPTVTAWAGLKTVLCYLKGTLKLRLLLNKSNFDNVSISLCRHRLEVS